MPSADFEVRLSSALIEGLSSRSTTGYNTWALDEDKWDEVMAFSKGEPVPSPRWSLVDVGSEKVFKCRISVPKKPVLFAGMIMDLDTGIVYHTYLPDVPAVELCSISDLFKAWTGSMFSVDTCISAVEKFKMTGSIDKMMLVLEGSEDCQSVIIRSLMASMGGRTSFGYEGSAFEQVRVRLRRLAITLRTIIMRLTNGDGPDFDKYLNPETIKLTVDMDSSEYSEQITCFGKLTGYAKYLHLESTMAVAMGFFEHEKLNKTELEALNLIEIVSASPTLCGFVYSSNYPRTLKRSIFSKLLDGRELSALVRNPDTVRWAAQLPTSHFEYDVEKLGDLAYGRVKSKDFIRCRRSVRYLNDIVDLFE